MVKHIMLWKLKDELSAEEKQQYTEVQWKTKMEAECKLTVTEDPTKFSFRLYLSNGVSDDVPLANMVKYRVLDPDGYYCKWDSANQSFIRYISFNEFIPIMSVHSCKFVGSTTILLQCRIIIIIHIIQSNNCTAMIFPQNTLC